MPPLAYLERQQALVDLGALQAGLPVSAGRVGAALIPRQVDEGELAVHLAPSPQNDLEHSVAAGRVCVGRRLSRGPGRETGPEIFAIFYNILSMFSIAAEIFQFHSEALC